MVLPWAECFRSVGAFRSFNGKDYSWETRIIDKNKVYPLVVILNHRIGNLWK